MLTKNTIYNTPVINTILQNLSVLSMKMVGWKVEGDVPDLKKIVIIAAPHTSNWDFVLTLLIAFSLKIKVYCMMKNTLFRGPLDNFFRWLGAIPIDRTKANNVVNQCIELFDSNEELFLVVPPSGTRKKVARWKTGFYHIANGADVPIVLGFIDYGRKVGGIGPVFIPCGNLEEDMIEIKKFYKGITAKYPEKAITHDE